MQRERRREYSLSIRAKFSLTIVPSAVVWQELQKPDSVDSADLTGTQRSLTSLAWVRTLLPLECKRPKDNGFSVRESEGAAEAVTTGFLAVLAQTFADKGYKLFLDPLAMRGWEETPPNDQAITPLKERFNSLFPPIEGSQDCKRALETSLKGDLEKLKDHDEFDVVVLSNASGTSFTKRGKVSDAINIYGDPHSLSFNIAVADRSTGELVYYCNSGADGDYLGSPESRLSGPIQKCLGKYFNVRSKHRR